jgi:ATP-binding cassette, subfamily B, bacterial PglK
MFLIVSRLISAKYRKQVLIVFFCSILLAIFEVLGIASIGPFMALVSAPEAIYENEYLYMVYSYFDFNNDKDFLISAGFFVISLLLLVNFFAAFMGWYFSRFSVRLGHYLSILLFSSYLNQPYRFFLNRNTSELGKNILNETHRVVSGFIAPAVEVMSKLIVSLLIISMLIILDPYAAFFAIFGVGITYFLIYFFFKVALGEIGERSTDSISKRFKISTEAMASIKELKLYGKEEEFIKRFEKISFLDGGYSIKSNLIAFMPRHVLESLIFTLIICAIIFMMDSGQSGSDIIPLLSVYALAGYRLMPMLQHIYRAATMMKYNFPAFKILLKDFENANKNQKEQSPFVQDIYLNSYLELKSIYFNYDNALKPSLEDINIRINHPSKIGIVGKTGSGKTTLVDIILGLFDPKSGELIVDGTTITSENKNSWQRNLGYVPQDVYLTDDSITRNIAFAVPYKDINFEMVKKAAKLAGIDDFIDTLPAKYETSVGEKGVRLSGGQLQRIGIARALYYDPALIVFDESTSALDNETEQAIMDAINLILNKKTIIIIAHRISTLIGSDAIYEMKNGKVISTRTYEELMDKVSEPKK